MFTKQLNPTFTAPVDIPVPGNTPDTVEFNFKVKTSETFDVLVKEVQSGDKTVKDAVREIVAGWSHPAVEFSAEKLNECFSLLPGSPLAIWKTYCNQLFEGRRKN